MWSADPNRIAIGRESAQKWEEETFACERNDMFVAVAKEFLAVIAGRTQPSCTLAQGVGVMDLIEAIRRAARAAARLLPLR